MKVPLVNLGRQYQNLKQEIDAATFRVFASGMFILGKEVEDFEQSLAKYIGVKDVVSVASGTDALLLCLRAIGVKPGDEVIVPAFTFVAPAEVIALLGARPVFVDVERESFNIDVSKTESAITARTKAIIPVHLYGQSADVDAIRDVAGKRNIVMLEDAAQAVGAGYKGSKVPSKGGLGAVSFFPTKNLGCFGDGGAIATNDERLADELRAMRSHGSRQKYEHSSLGTNSRLDAVQAAILGVKLRYLDRWNERRREIARAYTKEFSGLLEVPEILKDREHIFHLYTVKLKNRDKLASHLKEREIASAVHYPLPLHLQPAFSYLGSRQGDFPVSETLCKEVLSLPLFSEMTDGEVDTVIEGVKGFFS
jgi:hypothetical protein